MGEVELSPEVANFIASIEAQKEEANLRRMNAENQLNLISSFSGSGKETNLVEFQLDLEKELDKLFHFLAGHELKFDEIKKREYWAETDDDRLKILSNYGVKFLMKTIQALCNKHMLLGFYDADQVKFKVKDFSNALNDLFFENYENFLHYPSVEDLYETYRPIIKELNLDIDDEELYEKCIGWSEDELNRKYVHVEIIHQIVTNLVHSTYARAYLGLERKSLGERGININQSNSNQLPILAPEKKGWLK